MAKVICEFCGNYIQDTDPECPNCGAVNQNYKRVVKETPTTIEELQDWYRARNLPPEEVTRFFIGKDIKEPKAFGIYRATNGNFVVYKNKANGQRAVRYEGTDEAYAVNELYLRLKEEILNQKAINVKKNNANNRRRPSGYSKPRKKRGLLATLLMPWIMIFVFGLPSMLGLSFLLEYNDSASGYYLNESEQLYYYEGYSSDGYRWWEYDIDDEEWSIYETLNQDGFILDFNGTDRLYVYDAAAILGLEDDDINIYRSKAYIDAGNHYEPDSGYYQHDDDIYYYLADTHSSYGTTDNSGWYKYDTSTSDWEFYSDYENRDLIDDDLWYYEDDYYLGKTEYDFDFNAYDWDVNSFTSTTWYESYLENEAAYDSYYSSIEDDDDDYDWDWDSDSDYDWDSDFDWDSGGSDWDSDW